MSNTPDDRLDQWAKSRGFGTAQVPGRPLYYYHPELVARLSIEDLKLVFSLFEADRHQKELLSY